MAETCLINRDILNYVRLCLWFLEFIVWILDPTFLFRYFVFPAARTMGIPPRKNHSQSWGLSGIGLILEVTIAMDLLSSCCLTSIANVAVRLSSVTSVPAPYYISVGVGHTKKYLRDLSTFMCSIEVIYDIKLLQPEPFPL